MNSRSTHPTSTAEWSLAIHRVTRTSVEVWVGTLFPTLKMPERACVWLFDGKRKLQRIIHREEWRRPLSLIPREIRERIADDYARHWQALGSMLSRGGPGCCRTITSTGTTIPSSIPCCLRCWP